MKTTILFAVLSLAGCAHIEQEPLFPPKADLKKEIAACKGDPSCETATIEEFRADEAWRSEMIGLIMGIQSEQADRNMELFYRNAERGSQGLSDQLRRIPAPGANRYRHDLYLHR